LRNEANFPGGIPMSLFLQIAANRRNASKSTGPRTEKGKRCNAFRHGVRGGKGVTRSLRHVRALVGVTRRLSRVCAAVAEQNPG